MIMMERARLHQAIIRTRGDNWVLATWTPLGPVIERRQEKRLLAMQHAPVPPPTGPWDGMVPTIDNSNPF